MRHTRRATIALLLLTCLAGLASAHPATGIVVDANGSVFFLDTGEPRAFSGFIWKIDPQGKVTAVHDSGGHFLALDSENRFAASDLMGWFRSKRTQWLLRTSVPGSQSALIQADGSPIVMGHDGGLYYASAEQLERAGVEQIARLAQDGTLRTPTTGLPSEAKKLGGIRGLAMDQSDSLYVSYENAIQRVTAAGRVMTLAGNMTLAECDADAPENGRRHICAASPSTQAVSSTPQPPAAVLSCCRQGHREPCRNDPQSRAAVVANRRCGLRR